MFLLTGTQKKIFSLIVTINRLHSYHETATYYTFILYQSKKIKNKRLSNFRKFTKTSDIINIIYHYY